MIEKEQWPPSNSPNLNAMKISCLGSDARSYFETLIRSATVSVALENIWDNSAGCRNFLILYLHFLLAQFRRFDKALPNTAVSASHSMHKDNVQWPQHATQGRTPWNRHTTLYNGLRTRYQGTTLGIEWTEFILRLMNRCRWNIYRARLYIDGAIVMMHLCPSVCLCQSPVVRRNDCIYNQSISHLLLKMYSKENKC